MLRSEISIFFSFLFWFMIISFRSRSFLGEPGESLPSSVRTFSGFVLETMVTKGRLVAEAYLSSVAWTRRKQTNVSTATNRYQVFLLSLVVGQRLHISKGQRPSFVQPVG